MSRTSVENSRWPASIDDAAREDWGWKHEFDLNDYRYARAFE
jgi:hypothetical protein